MLVTGYLLLVAGYRMTIKGGKTLEMRIWILLISFSFIFLGCRKRETWQNIINHFQSKELGIEKIKRKLTHKALKEIVHVPSNDTVGTVKNFFHLFLGDKKYGIYEEGNITVVKYDPEDQISGGPSFFIKDFSGDWVIVNVVRGL